ncbi:hypothetical protein DFJ74DRAFT_656813 [Hyaloraphidium curvatum]|nr:hypothetical protein DFJ74DRAFT_656813 [Hyaloraphidium curvatum]
MSESTARTGTEATLSMSESESGSTAEQSDSTAVVFPASKDDPKYQLWLQALEEAFEELQKRKDKPLKQKKWNQIGAYFIDRWNISPLKNLVSGEGYQSEDVDWAVNGMILVNALLLTIPFEIMGNLGHDHWSWLESAYLACGFTAENATELLHSDFLLQIGSLYGIILCSGTVVLICTVYYFLRPPKKAPHFKTWWNRARWVILFIVCASALSDMMLAVLTMQMWGKYTVHPSMVCEWRTGPKVLNGGVMMAMVWLVIVLPSLSFLIMM